jgi:hypothetical protein
MSKIILLFLFTITSISAFPQSNTDFSTWNLTVVNKATNKGIDKATIAIGKSKYYSTTVDGSARIQTAKGDLNDSVRVSCIGYNTKWYLSGAHIKLPDTIELEESLTVLKEVKINLANFHPIALYPPKTKYKVPMHPDSYCAFAEYFPNETKIDGVISSVEVELNDDLQGIALPFSLEILSKSPDSVFPDSALIKDSIIVHNPTKSKRVTIDLSQFNLHIPKTGFFVVLETLPQSCNRTDSVWYDGRLRPKAPIPYIYLNEKNTFDGECCSDIPPALTGYYCLLGAGTEERGLFEKKNQWIVYAQGINFAISAKVAE